MSAGIFVLIVVIAALAALAGFWLVRSGNASLPGLGSRRVRISAADRAYLRDTWTHVQGVFVDNPQVALELAHSTVRNVLESRGVDTSGLPKELPEDRPATTEEMRQQLVRYGSVVNELIGAGR